MGDDTTGAAGLGFTVMVKDELFVQPLLEAETFMVPEIVVDPLLDVINEGTVAPLPDEAKPI